MKNVLEHDDHDADLAARIKRYGVEGMLCERLAASE